MIAPHIEAAHLLASLEPCMWITERGLRRFVTRLQAAASVVIPLEALAADPLEVRNDGVAVIPIVGEIVPRASAAAEQYLGLASIDRIRDQFRQAMADPNVSAVLFDVDSPGGFVSGVPDLADEILAARGRKRMVAAANDSAFSAAYYLASAADRIVLSRTAGVGSIGVIAVHIDESALLERMGVKFTAVKAGEKKDQFAFWKALSPAAEADLQAQVDQSWAMFVGHVAQARGLTPAAVRGFEAGTFFGADAVQVGLADRVTPAEHAAGEFSQMSNQRAGDPPAREGEMADEKTQAPAVVPIVQTIDLAAERTKWEGEQRARCSDIRDLFAGYTQRADLTALRADCIADPDCTPIQASKKLLAALAANSGPEISNQQNGNAGDVRLQVTPPNRTAIYDALRAADHAARG